MRCREEELAEAKTGAEGRLQGRDERAVWMAHAETAVASPLRSALWSDSQFHILEMQTGTPHRSPATRSSSSCLCVAITPHEQHTRDAWQDHSLRMQTRPFVVFPGSWAVLSHQQARPADEEDPWCRAATQAAAAAEGMAADAAARLEAVPTRRVNTVRAPASPVTTDAAGMAAVCQPLRVPKAAD